MRPRAIPAAMVPVVHALHAAGASKYEIAKRLAAKGCKASPSAVYRETKKATAAVQAATPPPGYRTAPATIDPATEDDPEQDLAAHRAARKAWMAMLERGGLKPEELERAQKGLVRAGDAIRKIQAVLGMGTDERPETSTDRLMAKLDEMAERVKRPVVLPAQAETTPNEPTENAKIA